MSASTQYNLKDLQRAAAQGNSDAAVQIILAAGIESLNQSGNSTGSGSIVSTKPVETIMANLLANMSTDPVIAFSKAVGQADEHDSDNASVQSSEGDVSTDASNGSNDPGCVSTEVPTMTKEPTCVTQGSSLLIGETLLFIVHSGMEHPFAVKDLSWEVLDAVIRCVTNQGLDEISVFFQADDNGPAMLLTQGDIFGQFLRTGKWEGGNLQYAVAVHDPENPSRASLALSRSKSEAKTVVSMASELSLSMGSSPSKYPFLTSPTGGSEGDFRRYPTNLSTESLHPTNFRHFSSTRANREPRHPSHLSSGESVSWHSDGAAQPALTSHSDLAQFEDSSNYEEMILKATTKASTRASAKASAGASTQASTNADNYTDDQDVETALTAVQTSLTAIPACDHTTFYGIINIFFNALAEGCIR